MSMMHWSTGIFCLVCTRKPVRLFSCVEKHGTRHHELQLKCTGRIGINILTLENWRWGKKLHVMHVFCNVWSLKHGIEIASGVNWRREIMPRLTPITYTEWHLTCLTLFITYICPHTHTHTHPFTLCQWWKATRSLYNVSPFSINFAWKHVVQGSEMPAVILEVW